MIHRWNPQQYGRFEKERSQPFYDLLQLIHPMTAPRILDLGCGDGILTKHAHHRFHAAYTLGIDTSEEMLELAKAKQTSQLGFQNRDVQTFISNEPFQLILSNAALQWIPDHPHLFKRLSKMLDGGGQLAIQMPANQSYPTHIIAKDLATEEPYKSALGEHHLELQVLSMEDYAQLLDQLGFESQIVRMQLYAHFLESTAAVLEWVKGSLLSYYESHLDPELYQDFLQEYRKRLIERLGWSEPFFFPMKRLFLWAQLPL